MDRIRHWTRAVLVANLVGQIGIIGTGGAVRLTDSGLGCSTWPQCEPGSFTPQFHEAT
ncbi:MAG TPA: COX15/CtaA family protein, partial [Promicromonospora sp.]|nr:COX15/CtaA family protein [Promicromonospora sp.]